MIGSRPGIWKSRAKCRLKRIDIIGFRNFVETSLEKYAICDWGNTCEVDQELNEHTVFHGERIVAKYVLDTTGDSIFIITEADRNITTILFTEEY